MTLRCIALNASASTDPTASAQGQMIASNAAGTAPDWIELIPRGPLIAGRDGRNFYISDPAAVVAATQPSLPLVVDFQHASELRPGEASPAAGWIEELEVRGGAIWGRVAWVERAANMIVAREYRFISPSFWHAAKGRADIIQLCSAGLVHKPNLDLKALNQRTTTLETAMDKAILAALGLSDTATAADVVVAINTIKAEKAVALNASQNPPLEKFVPAAQHTETVRALNAAQNALDAQAKKQVEAEVDAFLDDAVKGGKVAPGARDHFRALALNNFEATKTAITAMPSILKPGETAETKANPDQNAGALSPDEKAMCARMGLDEAAYTKAKAA